MMATTASQFCIWITVFLITVNVAVCTVDLDFRSLPAVIKPLETTNVSLQCLVTERTPYQNPQSQSYYYNQWGQPMLQTNPPPTSSDKSTVVIVRILKNMQDKWQVIAQISNVAPTTAHILDPSVSNADGILTDDLTRRSYILASWTVATADAFGTYRCDAISFDSQQNAVLTTSTQLSLGSSLNAMDFLLLLNHEVSGVLSRIDSQEVEQRSKQNLTDNLKTDLVLLEEETVTKQIEFEGKLNMQTEQLKLVESKFEKRINDMEREISEIIRKLTLKIDVVIQSGFLMLWPRGNYGLLEPESGCPFGGIITWKSGWRRHHTESTDLNQDSLSTETHLTQPILERRKGNNFITQHFCMKTEYGSVGPTWPKGSYCINKKGNCPNMFDAGYISWDEENDDVLQMYEGELPDGVFNNSDITTIEYCCRKDGPVNVPVYLPSSNPFYLYRYGGKCQQVDTMNVTEEYILFDTENTSNKDKAGQFRPDGRSNNVRLELCYYQRS